MPLPSLLLLRQAGTWWMEGLRLVLGLKEPTKQWRDLPLQCDRDGRHGLLELCGIFGCVVAIMLATKLAR